MLCVCVRFMCCAPPLRAQRVAVRLRMESEHGHVYWDATSFEHNLRAADELRWLIAFPAALMAAAVLANARAAPRAAAD